LAREERGAASIEYAILASLIAVVIVGAVALIAPPLVRIFESVLPVCADRAGATGASAAGADRASGQPRSRGHGVEDHRLALQHEPVDRVAGLFLQIPEVQTEPADPPCASASCHATSLRPQWPSTQVELHLDDGPMARACGLDEHAPLADVARVSRVEVVLELTLTSSAILSRGERRRSTCGR